MVGNYFPNPSANGICTRQIAEELKSNGWEVDIIDTRFKNEKTNEKIEGINIYRIKARITSRINQNMSNKVILAFNKLLNKVKLLLSFPTWPLISPLYTYRYYKKAVELHQKNKYDVVLSVYTPIDTLLAAYFMKNKYPDIKVMYYFLDALSGGIPPKRLNREWLVNRGKKWEDILFKNSDIIFILTDHKQHYVNHISNENINKLKVVDIPLIRKIESKKTKKYKKDVVNITYVGTILKHVKDPSYFLSIFSQIEKSNEDKWMINIVGTGDSEELFLEYNANNKGIPLTNHGQVSHTNALQFMKQSDFLINIGSQISTQIPSKIFEYMSTGNPIISFYKDVNEPSLSYLRKYPHALLIEESVDRIEENKKKIINFIDKYRGKRVEFSYIENKFANNTARPLVKIIENEMKKDV